MVPFGLFHIFLRPNSSTRASSGVMVAHLMPTLYFCSRQGKSGGVGERGGQGRGKDQGRLLYTPLLGLFTCRGEQHKTRAGCCTRHC